MALGAGFFVFLFFMTAAILVPTLIVVIPHSSVQYATWTPSVPAENFEIRACGCKNDWPLATNEREISNLFFDQTTSIPDPRGLSSLTAFFGQFVCHDMSLTQTAGVFGVIQLIPYDTNLTLMNIETRTNSSTGCKEPLNLNSAYVDATTVYGDGNSSALRTGCKLHVDANLLLPLGVDGNFIAGDSRATENAVIAGLHTLFARDHNRACDLLASRVPLWSEEQRFWKAREMVTARMYHITYDEWLPALLGSQIDLMDVADTETTDKVFAEFTVSAFRFGHSMIPEFVGNYTLASIFFNASAVQTYGIEPFLSGAYYARAEKADTKVVNTLRNFMFGFEDLITRDLFREREVGILPYPQLAACYGTIPDSSYQEPFLGLLSEPLVDGSSLPRTIAVILASQFRKLKYTIEFDDFLREQVSGITLARVIRENTNLLAVPDRVFFV